MSRTIKHHYTKSKAFDKTCRCHGGCPWCEGNRLIRTRKEFNRTSLRLALEEKIDSSYDLMEVIYPHKLSQYFESQGMSYYEDFTDDYTQHSSFIG